MKQSLPSMLALTAASCIASVTGPSAEAGPWADSFWGRRPPAYPVGAPVPVAGQATAYAPAVGYVPPTVAAYPGTQMGYANSYYPTTQTLGYGSYGTAVPPANNAPLLAPGFPQTVPAALPTAAYDTQWARTPVTYYRPVTAFDPRYGTTVTSLQPCTSYQYQAQRVPVIAPRPLLGEYGLQSNKWPSITGPGYNPTGLVANPVYPVAPTYQSVPNGGIAYPSQPAISSSSSMPTSTVPLNTIPYPGSSTVGAPVYTSPTTYPAAAPTYASSLPAVNYAGQAIGTGVVPSAAWMPAASNQYANSGLVNANPAVPTPYVPGATSVQPYGPPTYSATPNGSIPLGAPTTSNAFNSAGAMSQPVNPPISVPGYPGYANPSNPASLNNLQSPVMPSAPVMPNADPESKVRPSLGMGSQPANSELTDSFAAQRLPSVPVEQSSGLASSKPPVAVTPSSPAASLLVPSDNHVAGGTNLTAPSTLSQPVPLPSSLQPSNDFGIKPLYAPDDFDSKPNWNPALLDPDDRVALERSGQLMKSNQRSASRIRLQDEDAGTAMATVALSNSKSADSGVRLVSGEEPSKVSSTSNFSAFRPSTNPVGK